RWGPRMTRKTRKKKKQACVAWVCVSRKEGTLGEIDILLARLGRGDASAIAPCLLFRARPALFARERPLSISANHTQFASRFRERSHSLVELFRSMRRRELDADAGLALGHHGVAEADDVDAALQQLVGHLRRQGGVAEHHGQDRMLARLEVEARFF